MGFNPNIPMPGDFLGISQKQILSNYQSIANAWLENHVPLTNVDNVGKHEVLTLRPQGSDPTTAANQSAIYNKLVAGVPQLFFRSNTNQTPIQMSNSNLNTLQTGAPGNFQSSFLAGSFTIYIGYFSNCPNGQIISVLPTSTLVYVGLSTILVSTNTLNVVPGLATTAVATAMSGNSFTVTYNVNQILVNPTIYYTAIGI